MPTARFEGSDRKMLERSVSELDSADEVGELAKKRRSPIREQMEDVIIIREPVQYLGKPVIIQAA